MNKQMEKQFVKSIKYFHHMGNLSLTVWCKLNNTCVLSFLGSLFLDQACDVAQKADVAAVVMQEGLANVVLVTPAMTLLRAKVEVTIPRKRRGSCTQHEKVSHRCTLLARRLITCRRPNGVSFGFSGSGEVLWGRDAGHPTSHQLWR